MVNPYRRGLGLSDDTARNQHSRPSYGVDDGMAARNYQNTREGLEAGEGEPTPEAPIAESGDGWTDTQRELWNEIDAEGVDYENIDDWKARWLERARELGLSDEEAMPVLDSHADLDLPQAEDAPIED